MGVVQVLHGNCVACLAADAESAAEHTLTLLLVLVEGADLAATVLDLCDPHRERLNRARGEYWEEEQQ